uniref:Uncharacterized protein n=1 Tax=Rhizophora mucronata TaxID=61149 RepID=A0A2P2PSP5_RHIMU
MVIKMNNTKSNLSLPPDLTSMYNLTWFFLRLIKIQYLVCLKWTLMMALGDAWLNFRCFIPKGFLELCWMLANNGYFGCSKF